MRPTAFLLAAAVLASASIARAQIPNPSVHFGVFGGYHLFSDDADLRSDDVPRTRHIDSGGEFGVRIGYNFNWLIGTELQLEDTFTTITPTGGTAHALNFRLGLVFHMLKNSEVVIPFGTIGGGLYSLFSDDLGDDYDYLITYGLGVKFMLAEWVAFRVQADHVILGDGITDSIANNFDFTGGFDFFVSFAEPPLPPIPPDRDNDGVLDADDRCPIEPGTADLLGCPDTDKDGIADLDDQCVIEKGPASLGGCPDTDGDGIADRGDRCPKQTGLLEFDGCPDSDDDGIPDDLDRCPLVAGPLASNGCPPQPSAEQMRKFAGAVRGITFETGKAKIRPTSFPTLDEAVAVLTEFPDLQLVIEGHTDDRGKDEKNLKLSQERAESVKQYLMDKGIAAERLTATGYGETKPAAANDSETGRAENRRIEFRIIQPNAPQP